MPSYFNLEHNIAFVGVYSISVWLQIMLVVQN
jgi:hypothetical protein